MDKTSHRTAPQLRSWGRASALLLSLALSPPAADAQDAAPETSSCRAWRDCQALALKAAASGDVETFHDLAWRTMQTRGAQDPEVMLMLARAQTRSGRPHDALVMLRRITELGIAPKDALTSDTFARVRALRDWPQVEALIAGIAAPPAAVPSVTLAGKTPSPSSGRARSPSAPRSDMTRSPDGTTIGATPPAPRVTGTPATASPSPARIPEDLVPVGVRSLVPAGLAYDRVSGRVLVGNRTGRSVITISERLKTSMDLVRAASAGFHEVLAIAIDARQGDLWVASAAAERSSMAAEHSAALHKLQLVSGRPLTTVPIDVGDRPARFCGLAVTRNGSVFVLDAAAARLWKLLPGARVPSLVRTLDLQGPAGLAVDDGTRYAYVPHEKGLARLTLADGSIAPVTAPEQVKLAALESLVWHRGWLVALERRAESAYRLVRLRLNGRGTSAVQVDVLDPEVATCGGPSAATVSGADVYYLAADRGGESDCSLVVRRVRIR